MSEYPIIDGQTLAPIRVVLAQMSEDKNYLTSPACPYPASIKAFLSSLQKKATKNGTFLGIGNEKWAELESESAELYENLKNFGQSINADDVTERMSYFRTATQLLEKIVAINERAIGLKHIHEFQSAVMEIIDSVLTSDQRAGVMQRLRLAIKIDAPDEKKSEKKPVTKSKTKLETEDEP